MWGGNAAGRRTAMTVPFLACMSLVVSIYNLPPRVLPSIQATESGVAGLAVRNSNGTVNLFGRSRDDLR